MSRNGSGVYTLPPGINPVAQDTTITSNWANTTLSDIAAALTQSLARDGQTVPVANLPMGGFRHTGVGNPTARNQYASLGWVQDGFHVRLTSVGGTNAISAQLFGNSTTLQTGQTVQLIPTATNTGNVTLNINSIGPKPVVKPNNAQFAPGELVAGYPYILSYDGSKFVAVSSPATSGTVKGVSAGSGMAFDTITDTGSVTMGTPGTLTATTTNSVQAESHTHELNLVFSPTSATHSLPTGITVADVDGLSGISGSTALGAWVNTARAMQFITSRDGGSNTPRAWFRTYHSSGGGGGWTGEQEFWHSGNQINLGLSASSAKNALNIVWADVGSKPSTATRWPTVGEVSGLNSALDEKAPLSGPEFTSQIALRNAVQIQANSGGNAHVYFRDSSNGTRAILYWNSTNNRVILRNSSSDFTFHVTGDFDVPRDVRVARNMSSSGTVSDSEGNVRKMKFRAVNSTTTLNSDTLNGVVEKTNTGSYTYTIPSGLGSQGDAITIVASGSTGSVVINRGAGVQLFRNGVDANITLTAGSMVTIYRSAHNDRWIA